MIPVLLGGVTKATQVTGPGSWESLLGTLVSYGKRRGEASISLLNALTLGDLILGENLANPAACRAKLASCTGAGSRGGSHLPWSCLAAAALAVQLGPGGILHMEGCFLLLSAAGPSDCHLEIPFLPLRCQGTACLHLASVLPSIALPLAKFLPAVPSERHNSLFTYLFLLPVYKLSKDCFILRKISFPLALWMLFAQQKPLRDTDSGPSQF